MMKYLAIGVAAVLAALVPTFWAAPALAKEAFFIEQAAILGVYRDVCNVPVSDDAILTAVGSAMIEQALPRIAVIARATKRGKHIRNYILENDSQGTFCSAVKYYLERGYPK